MSAESKFAVFWSTLSQQVELPDELQDTFRQALQTAGYNTYTPATVTAAATTTAVTGTKPKKKLTGYNLFMREKSAELKSGGVEPSKRMEQVAALWKNVTQEEKEQWKLRASAQSAGVVVTPLLAGPSGPAPTAPKADKGPKHLTGYQLYVREIMAVIKADASVGGKDRMKKAAAMWKELDETQKNTYKLRAQSELTRSSGGGTTSPTTATVVSPVVEDEDGEEAEE